MNRIQEIKARVVNVANRETSVGAGKMRIPGMKIGSQMSPAGPKLEDVVWMAEKLEKAAEFLKTAVYEKEDDMHTAQKMVYEIEGGV